MRQRASTFLFLLCGAALALVIAIFLPGSDEPGSSIAAEDSDALDVAALDRRIGRAEAAMAELAERVARFRSRDAEAAPGLEEGVPPAVRSAAWLVDTPFREFDAEQVAAQLDATAARVEEFAAGGPSLASKLERRAGFSALRAQAIADRVDQLMVEAMDYQARTGIPSTPREADAQRERYVGRVLRREIGDADYERYRVAAGLPTNVTVTAVEPDSSAERAGILPGDVIVAHDGTRVMDLFELEELIAQGPRGSNALIEVIRDGELMQFYVEREPLGVVELPAIEVSLRNLEAERRRIVEGFSSSQ